MKHAADLFGFEGRVRRTQYVVAGILLFFAKYAIDLAIAMRWKQPWTVLAYVSPRLNPVWSGAEPKVGFVAMLFLFAIPFAWMGVSLSVRRLRDMGVHPFWSGLFFLPFLHFAFFFVLAIAPSRAAPESAPSDAPDAYRGEPPPPSRPMGWLQRTIPRTETGAFVFGVLASLGLGLVCFVITTKINHVLGGWLFVGVPFGMGFLTAFSTTYGGRAKLPTAIAYSLATQALAMIVLVALAWEGIACIVMAGPILAGMTALGATVGHFSARSSAPRIFGNAPYAIVLLPALVAKEANTPPEPTDFSVVSEVTIAAPADVVFRNVVSFPPIPTPAAPIFAVVAMPLEAKIDGTDPGATRRCVFTNGTFVEPIQVWDAPRELTFTVKEQPGNLDPYLDVHKGQFLLVQHANGTTTLRGTTWYRLKVHPASYWRGWANTFLHAIHLRVLDHVKEISEHPERPVPPPAPIPGWIETAHSTCNCTTVSPGSPRPQH